MLYKNSVKSLFALASAAGILVTSVTFAQAAPVASTESAVTAQYWTAPTVAVSTAASLTEAEENGLLYMREEEKLARDVYQALGEQWGARVFDNIANAEATHMQAVKVLLDRYDLPDPAAGNAPGEFTNPDLQALYDDLIAQGSQSIAAALQVGATIEEVDILDLEEHLAATSQDDITTVYNNLLRGSKNHLRAFNRNLEQLTGDSYVPQTMSDEDFASITSARSSQGRGRRFGR